MSDHYTLYGAPFSLYSGKARAYLIYKGIAYSEVFSSLKVYKNIIVPNTGVRFIPVVKTPEDEYLQDTSHIIDTLETRHPERTVMPSTPKQRLTSYLFEMWGDEWLVIPAMHYRWNKTNFPFIYQEFGKIILPNMPAFIRAFVGKKLGAKFKGFVPLLGITDKSIPAIEKWYEGHVLKLLDEHFSQHDYLLGSKPCLGDFGLMGPLYAHLFRDPSPGKLMRKLAPNVAKWVERMNLPKTTEGEFLDNDLVPATLYDLLQRMFKEQWPVMLKTVSEVDKWAEAHPAINRLPRSLGEQHFTIGDTTEKRAISTFHQWKVQRVLACYQQYSQQQKVDVDLFLQKLGGLEVMQTEIKKRVNRVGNQLVIED